MAAGLVVTVVLAVAGFAIGRDASASRPQVHAGEAWLSTTADGTVNLVDGVSGGSAAKVAVPGTLGHDMAVTQQGDLVFVRDTVTGAITVIDTAQLTAGVQIPHSTDTSVLAGAGVAYLVDATQGTVQRVDPATLAPVGSQVHLAGALGTAIVDKAGTLWAPVNTDGTVVPVSTDATGAPVAVGSANSDLVMALAGGTPTVVNRTAGTLTAVAGPIAGQVIRLPGAPDAGDKLQVASADSNLPLPLLFTGGTNQLVLVNIATRVPTSVGLPARYAADNLGSPLQAGPRTFIPDYTLGAVIEYDNAANQFGKPIQVLAGGGQFESEIVDGVVYFNDPVSGNAISVGADGGVHTILKNAPTVPATQTSSSAPPVTVSKPQPTSPSPSAPPTTEVPKPSTASKPVPTTDPPTSTSTRAPVPTTTTAEPKPTTVPPVTTPTTPPTTAPRPSTSAPTKTTPPAPHTTSSAIPSITPPTTPSTTTTPPVVAPPAVNAPKATVPGNNGVVSLTWNPPSDSSAIASYEVVVSPTAGTQKATGALSVDVSGLQCGVKYTFSVESVGKTGLKTSSGKTTSYACNAPGAPTGVTVSGTGVDGVKVTWSAPKNPGIGELTYDVTVNGSTKNAAGTSATFSGLEPGHPYTASVQAKTPGGTSAKATGNGDAGTRKDLTVNLNAVKKYYTVWGRDQGLVNCTWSNCPTWIQRTPNSYDDTKGHGDYVTTIYHGAGVPGFCAAPGYNTGADNLVHSNQWIYVTYNGHWGWMSSLWFNNNANDDLGLPQCAGKTPSS